MTPAVAERAAAVEFRFSGRTLTGPAVHYNERAQDRNEMFQVGAFAPLGDVDLNLQHDGERIVATTRDGSLRLHDTAEALHVEADLRADSAELRLVQRRALRGLSVEFRAIEEQNRGGLRVLTRAALPAVGLVDEGSYRTTVELRQFENAWLTAIVPTASALSCECSGPSCDSVLFEPDSFALDDGGDILAFGGGGAQHILGSLNRGTLLVEMTDDGLRVGLTERGTDTARRITEDARAAPLFVRPILDLAQSEYVEVERLRTFSRASVRAFVVKATSASKGHRPAVIDGVESRRRLWL